MATFIERLFPNCRADKTTRTMPWRPAFVKSEPRATSGPTAPFIAAVDSKESQESQWGDLDLALFTSRDRLDVDRLDIAPNTPGPPHGSGADASNAAY
jgi:hypothetical protein